jgi:cobalt-zinc-cadmium efflux system protein
MGEHHHNHNPGSLKGKNLFYSIVLNLGISVAQTIGGILSGSIALLSDALHNFSDVLSLAISYVAHRLASRKFTTRYTFGLQRAEILAAFINSAVLMGIAVYLGFEAIGRMMHPQTIKSMMVVWLALASIVVNGLSVLLIKSDAKKSINIKSAYLHLFTDMLTSVAVLAGGLIMKFYGIFWVDGLITLLIACYLIYSSWHLFVESINIIMLCSPGKIDVQKLTSRIESLEGVKNLHHLHLWLLTDNQVNMEAHIDLEDDRPVSEFEKQLEQIHTIAHEMGIDHVTIQPEFVNDDDKSLIHQH